MFVENYLIYRTNCCEKEHMNDYGCASNFLEEDDPWHRFDGLRCLNMTRPIYTQDYKCTDDPIPSPIAQATTNFDMSQIYNALNQGDRVLRSFVDGQLEVEEENGKIWPPNGQEEACVTNQADETRCFKWHRNALLPTSLFTIWFVRLHNYVASNLAAVNPCWDDETLFKTAREICIAWSQQMYLYEWLDALVGHENLVHSGVISDSPDCRENYNDKCYPQVSLEYNYALRWFHIMQETKQKLYDSKGRHIDDFAIVNASFRVGLLAKDDYIDQFTQGCFRQPTSNYDHSVDFDIAEKGAGEVQKALDIVTSDLHKNRLFGLAPYIDYVYKCTGITITSFDDLVQNDIISESNVALLKEIYEDVIDVDLMSGLWLENPMKGGKIPQTLACIMMEDLLQSQTCDRHWYERCDRPHAFTKEQMLEVRKLTLAMMLCAVGDGVTEIQPHAFLNISPENPLTSCSELPQFNFNVFADSACQS
ncbi:peroxidase-like [Anticarsia gemmatalis]|uniref:peroxidase-like n=1 Tax=Anticarsia gemmatalis TaxID=129554 RepID=UPI003F777A96